MEDAAGADAAMRGVISRLRELPAEEATLAAVQEQLATLTRAVNAIVKPLDELTRAKPPPKKRAALRGGAAEAKGNQIRTQPLGFFRNFFKVLNRVQTSAGGRGFGF
jgi:hypothetical protein